MAAPPASKPAPPKAKKATKKTKKTSPSKGSQSTGSKAQAIAAYADLLGTVPDAEIAKKAGVHVRTVFNYRAANNIPGYVRSKKGGKRKARKPRTSKVDAFASLIGTVPDRVVAEKAGASVNTVRNYRVRHGIPAYTRGSADSTPTPAPPKRSKRPAAPRAKKSAATSSAGFAWHITFEGLEERAVVAPNAAEAATRAGQAGLGQVVAIRRLMAAI